MHLGFSDLSFEFFIFYIIFLWMESVNSLPFHRVGVIHLASLKVRMCKV